MIVAIVGGVLTLSAAALLAWRWWLEFRRWDATRADKARDEALATLEPRMRAVEDALRNAEYAKLGVRR